MLGSKLFNLLKDLSTADRKLLFYKEKKTEDKRFKQFIYLLKSNLNTADDFNKSLMQIKNTFYSGQSEKIKNDHIRRLIDFCIKQIEDLKIEQFIKDNSSIRNYILTKVYNKTQTRTSYQDYLSKLYNSAKDSNEFWIMNYYINKMANLKLLSQTDDDFKEWRNLLSSQINLIQEFYHEEIGNVYSKIGSSYVDDRTTLNQFKSQFLNQDYILKQIEIIPNLKVKANLYLTLARFNFEDEVKYALYSTAAIRIIKNVNDSDSDLIRRKIFFASFLHAFHFNHSYSVLKKLLLKIISFNKKAQFEEPKIYFYLFLIQIVKNDKEGDLNYYNINAKKYFIEEEFTYFYNFLEALQFYKSNDYKSTKRVLNKLSLVKNPYIVSWSNCLEIITNYKQGNVDLTERLITKEFKKLASNSNRIFTINSSIVVTVKIANLINLKIPKNYDESFLRSTKLSPIHNFMIDTLKN